MIPTSLMPYLNSIPQFIIAFIFALLLTPIIAIIARRLNIVDLPTLLRNSDDNTGWRRIHNEIKLKLGGVAVIIPFLILTFIFVPPTKEFIGLILGILILLICGVLDDKYEFSSKIQATCHILAGTIIAITGTQINSIQNPFGGTINFEIGYIDILGINGYLLAMLVTIIWIFFIINAVKWVSGTDGLVEGNTAIAAIIIGLLSIRFENQSAAIMGFIFAGAMLGFLPYNFYPSKILSGSSGKSVYGFILGVLAIYSGGKLGTFILTLSLPIMDAIWVIFYRIKKHKPKNLFHLFSINDKSHIHHKLLDMGFSQRQVAIIEYLYTLIVGIFAFLLTGLHKALAITVVFTALLIAYIYIAKVLKRKNSIPDKTLDTEEK